MPPRKKNGWIAPVLSLLVVFTILVSVAAALYDSEEVRLYVTIWKREVEVKNNPDSGLNRLLLGEAYLWKAERSDAREACAYVTKAANEFLAVYEKESPQACLEGRQAGCRYPLSHYFIETSRSLLIVRDEEPDASDLALAYRLKDALLGLMEEETSMGEALPLYYSLGILLEGALAFDADMPRRKALYADFHNASEHILARNDDPVVRSFILQKQLVACVQQLEEERDPVLRQKRLSQMDRIIPVLKKSPPFRFSYRNTNVSLIRALEESIPARRESLLKQIMDDFSLREPSSPLSSSDPVLPQSYLDETAFLTAKATALRGDGAGMAHALEAVGAIISPPYRQQTVRWLERSRYFDPVRGTPEFRSFIKELKGEM